MGKLSDWEKGLLMQDVAKIGEKKVVDLSVQRPDIYGVVVYGIAAAVAVLVFMWGQA